MSYAFMGSILTIICWKWGDWRGWGKYYPTILYVYIGNVVYDMITCEKPFWAFGEIAKNNYVLELIIITLIYPATVILYLTFYPKTISKQISYIILCVAIFIGIEAIALYTDGFIYYNGWNLYYSIVFDFIMFPLIRLHYKRPLLVWPVSILLAFVFIWWFNVPLTR